MISVLFIPKVTERSVAMLWSSIKTTLRPKISFFAEFHDIEIAMSSKYDIYSKFFICPVLNNS